MSFSEHAQDTQSLHSVTYGCFVAVLTPALEDEMKIRYVFGKLDYLTGLRNRGKPIQFLYIFKEFCDYLNCRKIPYRLSFRWTLNNHLLFNLKCLAYLLVNISWLKTF